MATRVWFKCKVCGTEMFLEGDPTIQNLIDGLELLATELRHKNGNPIHFGDRCKLYSMEWSLKQFRKGLVVQSIVVEETEARKEITA
jgi:hypothetical protein